MSKRWFPLVAAGALALLLVNAGTSSAVIVIGPGGFSYGAFPFGLGYGGYPYGFTYPSTLGAYRSVGYPGYGYGTAGLPVGNYGYYPGTTTYPYAGLGYNPGYAYSLGTTSAVSGYYSPVAWAYSPGYFGRSGTAPASYSSSYSSSYGPNSYGRSPAVGPVGPATTEASAVVDVFLPADAELWFDGERTTKSGDRRTFQTPPLERGHGYHYDVRARWVQDGKVMDRTRHVSVRAGQRVSIDFLDTGL